MSGALHEPCQVADSAVLAGWQFPLSSPTAENCEQVVRKPKCWRTEAGYPMSHHRSLQSQALCPNLDKRWPLAVTCLAVSPLTERPAKLRTNDRFLASKGLYSVIATTPCREHGDDRELQRSRLQAGACDEARTRHRICS